MHNQNKNSRFESHLIENREVRIFLSSTFSDMNAERSALVKLFDKLKLEANKRNVSLSLIDLRWGVTDEEARTGKVLSVCLNEIENSHPFFIGLLGSRYGYSPRKSELLNNPDLEERYPWLRQDIDEGLSITEMEMQYGVLRNQETVDAAFFIKDTPNTLPDDDEKLSRLKQEIRSHKRFPVGDYHSVDELCIQVEKTVCNLLDKYFSDADNTRLGRERNIQRAYINSRHKYYVRRQEDFNRLDDFLTNNERHLVVTGPSGIGKSALIANWLKEKEAQKDLSCNIICHFVGNTFGGNRYEEVLQHLSDELFDLYDGLEVRLGSNESPEQKAQRYMTEAVQSGRPMLIVIDGINQISEHNNGKLLTWLPQARRNVKYLFTTLETDVTMKTFHRLGFPIYHVGPLEDDQRRLFISEYLSQVGKKLSADQINRILNSPIIENTLVLKTLLDELICFGSYEHLDERINRYLSASKVADFFDRTLQRMEEDYECVSRLMSLLAVSEKGLSEDELIAITGMRQIAFHLFYCAASQFLVVRNGLLTFAHQYISDAVWKRYGLSELQLAKTSREEIIRYFSGIKHVDYKRWISELAFQYYHTNDCEHLYQTIMSFEAFRLYDASNEGRAQLAMYWRKLLKKNPEKYRLRNYLDLPYDSVELDNLPYLRMGLFVSDYFADYQTSMMFSQTYLMMAQSSGKDISLDVASSYNNIGVVYLELGDYDKAQEYYFRALAIDEKVLGLERPSTATSYNNIGVVYDKLGIYDKSLEYYFRALAIKEKVFGLEHPYIAMSYNNIGVVYHDLGDYDKSLEYYFRALAIKEKVFGLEHPSTATSYNNIGGLYYKLADYDKSLEYSFKALAIYERVFGTEHPDTAISYNCIGGVYNNLDDYDKSLEYHFKALSVFEKVFGAENPNAATSYDNIGTVYHDLGDYDKSLEYYFKALAIREKLFGLEHPSTATSYNNIGVVYLELGDYDKAQEYNFRVLAIREKVLGLEHPSTATSYNNIGGLYYQLGDYDKSLEYHFKALSVFEKVFGAEHPQAATSYDNIGMVYHDLGDYDKSLEYYFRALAIREKVLGLEHPSTATSYNNIGGVYHDLDDYDKALEYFFKALTIDEKVLGPEHPNTKVVRENIDVIKSRM